MRGFLIGVLVGALAGGGGVYLAIERPWASGESAAGPDAGAEEAQTTKKKKRRRGKKRRGRRQGGAGGEEQIPELTEEDQKLVWRGAAVELPPREVDYGSGEGGGRSLSPSEINRVIKSGSQPVVECIEEARGNAPLKAAVTFELLVDGQGFVTKSRVRAPAYLFEHGFAGCARTAARQLRFPATGAHTVVTAPYDLY